MRDIVDRDAEPGSKGSADEELSAQGLSGVVLSGATRSSTDRTFSSPGSNEMGWLGVALPQSVETLRARLAGLRGDVRRRIAGLEIFALGGYGTARGD
jgi:hypothetical protein